MITSEVLRTDQHLLANEGDQRWGCVGNRGWDSRRTPDMNGFGFVTPIIMGPLGETTISPRVAAVGLLGIAVAITGTAIGAYQGAKKSEQWAAGGAVVGLVAAGLVNSVLAAIIGAKAVTP